MSDFDTLRRQARAAGLNVGRPSDAEQMSRLRQEAEEQRIEEMKKAMDRAIAEN